MTSRLFKSIADRQNIANAYMRINESENMIYYAVKLPDNKIAASSEICGWKTNLSVEQTLLSYVENCFGTEFMSMCQVYSKNELEDSMLNPFNVNDWVKGSKKCDLCGKIYPQDEFIDSMRCLRCEKIYSDSIADGEREEYGNEIGKSLEESIEDENRELEELRWEGRGKDIEWGYEDILKYTKSFNSIYDNANKILGNLMWSLKYSDGEQKERDFEELRICIEKIRNESGKWAANKYLPGYSELMRDIEKVH